MGHSTFPPHEPITIPVELKRWPDTAPDAYADEAPCQRCEKPVTLDHDPPCPHGFVGCPECGHEAVCADCRREAFAEMCRTGDYDPKADVLFDHTAPKPRDHIEEDGGYWWDGSFVEVPRHG